MNITDIREEIESLVGEYCDGTYIEGLKSAHFIEYFSDEKRGPQELADRIVEYITNLVEA